MDYGLIGEKLGHSYSKDIHEMLADYTYDLCPLSKEEFTKRAFLNGRIDLSQAESVIDIIQSKNDFALKSSVNQLQGSLNVKIKEIRQKIIHEIAFIESALDDPEHISIDGYGERLKKNIDDILVTVDKMIASSENGGILKEGIHTVIVGKPNAGKSSLLNLLVGQERAIVTDIAGTTRDILEEQINLNGITLNIIDTAGIRSTEDVVEKIGVDKAREHVDKADFIIYVVDSSTSLDENDMEIIEMLKGRRAVVLLNKSDLSPLTTEEQMRQFLSQKIISVSTKEHTGIDELEETIKDMFFHGELDFNDEVFITNIRHKNALINTKQSLSMVLGSIFDGMPEDFYSIDLRNAYEELSSIIGESMEEDLVNEIFSKFCMGK